MLTLHRCSQKIRKAKLRRRPSQGKSNKHEFYENFPSITFYSMKISFSDIDRKWILPNMIRAVPLPTNIRKGDFYEIKCDGRTSFHKIHDIFVYRKPWS